MMVTMSAPSSFRIVPTVWRLPSRGRQSSTLASVRRSLNSSQQTRGSSGRPSGRVKTAPRSSPVFLTLVARGGVFEPSFLNFLFVRLAFFRAVCGPSEGAQP